MYPPANMAGAEMMAHSIFREMAARGWEVTVVVEPGIGDYEIDGVRVASARDALDGCAAVFTHLDRTPQAESYCVRHGTALVHILHNHLTLEANRVAHADLIVYNTCWLSEAVPNNAPSVIVHPPVWPDDYHVTPGKSVTLINLSAAKGAGVFYDLARRMPDVSFLGVTGAYGEQEPAPRLDNLAILPTQTDARRIYERTRLLLMPSAYESYGRVAVEASVSGIPTLASDTPGLREALEGSGRIVYGSWAVALRDALADIDQLSAGALARGQRLDPSADIDRMEAALMAVI